VTLAFLGMGVCVCVRVCACVWVWVPVTFLCLSSAYASISSLALLFSFVSKIFWGKRGDATEPIGTADRKRRK